MSTVLSLTRLTGAAPIVAAAGGANAAPVGAADGGANAAPVEAADGGAKAGPVGVTNASQDRQPAVSLLRYRSDSC